MGKIILAEDIEVGDVVKFNGMNLEWDGDTYDEDTLWMTEVGTYTPYALDVHEEVELCT